MSKACTSPTARLLQNSRLFSLPKPLPSAVTPVTPSGINRQSKTATKPYPTHQAIDTPYSSRAVGEWGLKRHLPLRTTSKSDKPLRVLAQDTNDHVTDFASSADHSMTLTKFQELAIPMLQAEGPGSRSSRAVRKSVYEDAEDNTNRFQNGVRWKSTGPWLLSMNAQATDDYLKEIALRRPEWLAFLSHHITEAKFKAMSTASTTEKGHNGPIEFQSLEVQREKLFKSADEQIEELARRHRKDMISLKEFDEQSNAINEGARSRAMEIDSQIELEEGWRAALTYMSEEDQRARDLGRAARIAYNAKVGERSGDAEHQEECEAELVETENEIREGLQAAYRNVFTRFDVVPEDDADLAKEARKLLADAAASMAADTKLRDEGLAAWVNHQRYAACTPTKEQVESYEKDLRDAYRDERLNSELSVLLAKFLDLPGLVSADARSRTRSRAATVAQTSDLRNHLLEKGFMGSDAGVPLTTHPGAGLGYLRAKVHMENHPIHGPQAQKAPVQARVLRARTVLMQRAETAAKLGVAGFVATDSLISAAGPRGRGRNTIVGEKELLDEPAQQMDPYLAGGGKIMISTNSAIVDEAGKVIIQVARPSLEAISVKIGGEKLEKLLETKKSSLGGTPEPTLPNRLLGLRDPSEPQARYGVGLLDSDKLSQRPRI